MNLTVIPDRIVPKGDTKATAAGGSGSEKKGGTKGPKGSTKATRTEEDPNGVPDAPIKQ
ncbi:hypothetical protein CC1G_07675 [Coprinopsis cinerea okayama7|uniref:Uncharacterized protein n=1 Tax=Coprinopsis cinerea (strain Okayama-7 / 130 / ATCC MYA-4618 / FGSC 9003) TaxID=240176 RepID=A8NC71_COPC7|nr:hypothetical protein CC1G_07675 [Coprinopsis cinerea okayama7\|eukprot:XP_001832415.2 hypothetical protein CC1G_07675 [Coprinopsis cinerea okayama7\